MDKNKPFDILKTDMKAYIALNTLTIEFNLKINAQELWLDT